MSFPTLGSKLCSVLRHLLRKGPSTESSLHSLATITIDDICFGLDHETFTAVDLVNAHIARIHEVNSVFNAVIEINPDAVDIAKELDKELKVKKRRSPLHGVPILLKDNIYTDDSMTTAAGSYAFVGAKPPREATAVQKLREAGAILLGKTNLSEFANFRSTNASNGWSPRGGQTFGAYVPDQESQGSSSGSGVAVALGLAPVSLGTETDGSIVLPSMKNNVVGFRTTTGLVSRDGVVPLSDRQDTVGPMARTVRDAAHVLSVIAGTSQYDAATTTIPFDDVPDYAGACQGSDLTGLRIGVPRRALVSADQVIMASFEQALKTLADLGATVIDDVEIPSQDEWDAWDSSERRRALEAEFKSSINRWCGELVENPEQIADLDGLIKFVQDHPKEAYPRRNIERLLGSKNSPGVDAPSTQDALKKMLRCCADEGLLAAISANNLDALVFPNVYDLPSTCAARAGFPVFAVPLGFYPQGTKVEKTPQGDQVDVAPNVPYGLAFSAGPYSELGLIRIAHAFQKSWSLPNVAPYLMPTSELSDFIEKHPRDRLESL